MGAYIFFIIFLSFFPVPRLAHKVSSLDKSVHFFIYGGFSFLMVNTLVRPRKSQAVILTLFFAFFLGLIIEIGQFFLSYRSFEGGDILCNFLGSLAGILFILANKSEIQISKSEKVHF